MSGFASHMRRVLDMDEDLAAMGAYARQVAVERFNNRVLIKKVEDLIIALSPHQQKVI